MPVPRPVSGAASARGCRRGLARRCSQLDYLFGRAEVRWLSVHHENTNLPVVRVSMRILLADNDQEVAEFICKELEDESHSVSVCHDGAAGLRAAQLQAFEASLRRLLLILVDRRSETSVLDRRARDEVGVVLAID